MSVERIDHVAVSISTLPVISHRTSTNQHHSSLIDQFIRITSSDSHIMLGLPTASWTPASCRPDLRDGDYCTFACSLASSTAVKYTVANVTSIEITQVMSVVTPSVCAVHELRWC